MSVRPRPDKEPLGSPTAVPRPRRWILFVHQLPPRGSNLRVRVWRRLQQIGAIVVRHAVYVLPDSPGAREDFEWLKAEIQGAGGQANVFAADSVDAWSDDALVAEFRRSRQETYAALARDIEKALRKNAARGARARRLGSSPQRFVDGFRQRLAAIERVDFFGSAGRDRVVTLLEQLGERVSAGNLATAAKKTKTDGGPRDTYRGRLWVTRPRPGVDRMGSAWLIKRFIDAAARFGFVPDRDAAPRDAVPFDMFGVEFTHQGADCTFETLCKVFDINDAAIRRVANIVHDLDLKDGHFGTPEATAIGAVIEGLQLMHADDDTLLTQGMTLFEALYRAFEQSARRVGPRPVVRPRAKRRRSQRSSQ